MNFCNQDISPLSTFGLSKILKVLIIMLVFSFPVQRLFSQHISRDNHKGNWDDSGTWDPEWKFPLRFISGYDITIYGYVTSDGWLGFYNMASRLIVNDTLVINGNLYLHNNNDLIINDSGVLIVRGDFYIDEHSLITSNGYFIITGDIHKDNDRHFGSFTSNDDPPKVFIGGIASPSEIIHNFTGYPVLNCDNPATIPYPHSGCSSGNMEDLHRDPVFLFFQSTCNFQVPSSKISVCHGDSIRLAATGGEDYTWKGPADFSSNLQNPFLTEADSTMSGIYTVYIIADHDCEEMDTIDVIVNPKPAVSISCSDDTVCMQDQLALTGIPAGGTFTVESGPGSLTDSNILQATEEGKITIQYMYNKVCAGTATRVIISKPQPRADAGVSQQLVYVFETTLSAGIHPGEQGTWSLVSGSGKIQDPLSPESIVTGLSPGDNVFSWTVSNGACESESGTTVTVQDLVIPSVFTPNGDGINDNFSVSDYGYPFEITVFNQLGLTEYKSYSYVDHWDGTNNKGNSLPPETYFYVLRFENGLTRKGTVLIVK